MTLVKMMIVVLLVVAGLTGCVVVPATTTTAVVATRPGPPCPPGTYSIWREFWVCEGPPVIYVAPPVYTVVPGYGMIYGRSSGISFSINVGGRRHR